MARHKDNLPVRVDLRAHRGEDVPRSSISKRDCTGTPFVRYASGNASYCTGGGGAPDGWPWLDADTVPCEVVLINVDADTLRTVAKMERMDATLWLKRFL